MSVPNQRYQRGTEFPNEGFVRQAIERYFLSRDYAIEHVKDVDLACSHPQTGEKWVIEAKGKTASIGTDFNTGLGQLLKRIPDPSWKAALAVPDTPQFHAQCNQVGLWIREALQLSWIFVDSNGSVLIVDPDATSTARKG